MNNQTPLYSNITIDDAEISEKKIKGEISAEVVEKHRKQAIEKINTHVTLPGFRKGHVPEQILVSHIGELALWEEMAEMALKKAYPKIITDHSLDPLGEPYITITKMAPKNTLEFEITTAIMPIFDLPDYKQIALDVMSKKDDDLHVTDKEVDDAILQIRRAKAHNATLVNKDVDAETKSQIDAQNINESDLPELNQEFIDTIGNFKDVDEFKQKLTAQMAEEKKSRAKDKKRIQISELLVEKTSINLPAIVIEAELDKIASQFKNDILRMGVTFEDYLEKAKKTENELRTDWRPDATKRAKIQLIINAIAKAEKIELQPDEVSRMAEHILKTNKEANPEAVNIYVATILINDKVFNLLENQV